MPNEITTIRRSLVPTTYTEALEFAQHLSKSSMVPAEYRGKPENILLAIQWGMEVGLAPLQAIQNIAVINGKPSVYGDALLAMVKGSPVYEDVVERFEGSGDTLTAICEARRKGNAPVVSQFSVADAKRAGLWNKAGPWQSYPRRMLQMRARGFALRDAFADVLRGVITREEAEDYPVDVSRGREPIDVTPKADLDQFAGERVDLETGEIGGADALNEVAMQAAYEGTEEFRKWWKTLGAHEREALRSRIPEYQTAANEADARHAAERDVDPFGLPPLTEQTSRDNLAERPGAGRPDQSPRQGEPLQNFGKLVATLTPPQKHDLGGDDPDELDWPRFADAMVELIRRATADDLARTQFTALPQMKKLRTEDSDSYRRVIDAVRERTAALQAEAA